MWEEMAVWVSAEQGGQVGDALLAVLEGEQDGQAGGLG